MEYEIITRMLSAVIFGIIIGIERQWHNCIAGLRTNVLVSIGACLFVLLEGLSTVDHEPKRIAAQIVSGIGFMGAGVLIKEGLSVRGLDTAATLWCTAAIGTLSGYGYDLVAIAGTILVVAINSILRPFALWIDKHKNYKHLQNVPTIMEAAKDKI
ncbi:MgtC/SapB family protein [Neobacillus drentensis]|uniref:MgtC/SapB family protein n=1 Tax=Neobacillus drentensis TaxID=220684 RepID=UPI00300289B2